MKVSPAQREVSSVRKKRRKRMTADHQLRKQMMRARVTARKTMVRKKNGRDLDQDLKHWMKKMNMNVK